MLSACVANANNDVPLPPPTEAAASIVALIEVAADTKVEDPELAWNEAHHAFETTLESRLVAHYGAARVAPLEYGFSRLHQGLGKAGAAAVASELGAEIVSLSASLPVPPAG